MNALNQPHAAALEVHMRLQPIAVVFALACLGTSNACTRSPSARAGAAPAPVVTKLEVENQGFLDMNIYVMRDAGVRQRLGTATGNSKTTLTIPEAVMRIGATQLKFVADPIGGRRASVSSSIIVNPGDIVTLRIPPG